MTWTVGDLEAAHKHATRTRHELERSTTCGCFCCCATFPATEVREWALDWVEEGPLRCRDQKPVTATCPRCNVDSVLGDASGYPVTDNAFLLAMRAHWF